MREGRRGRLAPVPPQPCLFCLDNPVGRIRIGAR
jgi:hypothetical protein